jgi:hypothetical protein
MYLRSKGVPTRGGRRVPYPLAVEAVVIAQRIER